MKRGRGRGERRAPLLVPRDRVRRTPWTVARRYVGRWHAVDEWAADVLGAADEVEVSQPNPRVAKRRAVIVRDIDDNEEAYDRGAPLESFDLPAGPTQEEGGRRRVIVRVYTWTVDEVAGSVYEPQWITIGFGRTARMASDHAARYVRRYAFALNHGVASRRLLFTATEVTWWTAKETTDYV